MRNSYLFLGVYTASWKPSNFDKPITLCKQHGITGLMVKVYEKTQGLWYGGNFDVIAKRITAAGLVPIPYGYHYGGGSLAIEAQIASSFMSKYGVYCMDAESDFDGHDMWGYNLAGMWKKHPGELWVSTWANVGDHNWLGIVGAMKDIVQAWMPQVYSDKLANLARVQWPKGLPMQPTIGIIGDGDQNHPVDHVSLFGDTDISIWEYQEAAPRPNTMSMIMQALGKGVPAPLPGGGETVSILANFPMVPERTEITGDGHPSENEGLDCVPASFCAGAMCLNGVKQLGGVYTPDSFKDAVYGQGTTGGESPSAYVGYLYSLGIDLSSVKGSSAQLVSQVHQEIEAGHPVGFTEPNPYGNPAFTHFCIFYGAGQGTLTAMDPWIAQPVTRADAEWTKLLLNNEVWSMSKIGDDMPIALTINDVKQYFKVTPEGSWMRIDKAGKPVLDSAGNAIVLKDAMKDDWCSHGIAVLADIGLPVGSEFSSDPAHPEVVDQRFERCMRRFDKGHIEDSPPHAGAVYSPHIEGLYSAQDKLNLALDSLAILQKQLDALKAGGNESAYIAAVKTVKEHMQAIAAAVDPLAV